MNKKTLSLKDILKLINAEKKGKDDFLDVTIGKGWYEIDGLCVGNMQDHGSERDHEKLIDYVYRVIKQNRNLYVLPDKIYLNSYNTGMVLETASLV